MEFKPTHTAKPVQVFARRIKTVGGVTPAGGPLLVLEDDSTHVADAGMIARHFPLSGDYLIISSDGYSYLNPADVFERKYEPAATVTAESIMTADLPDTEFTARFPVGQGIMFQPNIAKQGRPDQYDGAVFAMVAAARAEGPKVLYDLCVLYHEQGDDYHVPVNGVDSLMVLPLPDEPLFEDGVPPRGSLGSIRNSTRVDLQDAIQQRQLHEEQHLRLNALQAALASHGETADEDQVTRAAKMYADFIATGEYPSLDWRQAGDRTNAPKAG